MGGKQSSAIERSSFSTKVLEAPQSRVNLFPFHPVGAGQAADTADGIAITQMANLQGVRGMPRKEDPLRWRRALPSLQHQGTRLRLSEQGAQPAKEALAGTICTHAAASGGS
jgi:hypothetical protein